MKMEEVRPSEVQRTEIKTVIVHARELVGIPGRSAR